MGDVNSCRITSASFLAVLQEIENVLSVAFGPEGKAVMITKPTGQMTITRSGFNIMNAVYASNGSPSIKILLNCVEKLHEECGDGVKSVMFLTGCMLKYFERLEGRSRLVQQLGTFQSRLVHLRGKLENRGDSALVNDVTPTKICRDAEIINTFFKTRFPTQVSTVLGFLLHNWISKLFYCFCSKEKYSNNTINLNTLIKNFSVLCHFDTGSQSVSSSCIKEGFLVSRKATNLLKSGQYKLVILLCDDHSSSEGRFDQVDILCEIKRILNKIKELKLNSAGKCDDNFLLLTPVVVPELAIFCLRQENVAVIDGAPIDEVNYISYVTTPFQEKYCDELRYSTVEILYESGKDYTFLKLPNIYNLFICGPTNDLRAEYSQTCCSALKLLLQLSNVHLVTPYTEGGGNFERNLNRLVSGKFDLQENMKLCVTSRTELLLWHKERAKYYSSIAVTDSNNSIHSMIAEAFQELDRDVIEGVMQGVMVIPRKLNGVCLNAGALEPVACKLLLIQVAVATVISILNIDGIIHVTRCPTKYTNK